ncbi:MAG: hypothetical protein R3344_05780 [Acidobacteriota bacterium]|nr:hypothetical protein [Acidobacteriota bacterium]
MALRRTVAVVSTRDRDRWGKTLGALLPGNIVVQPHDRGTAAAILRPLLSIARRDSCANVILVPSRQLNSHVTLLRRDLATAVDFLDTREKSILLLGVVPVGSHPGRDWILPEGPDAAVQHVRALLDAPGLFRAAELRARGALINSLVVAARARDLVDAYIKTLPDLVFRFLPFAQPTGLGTDTVLQEFYRDLPALDFYRDVLGRCAAELFVLRVADRLPRAPKLSA